MQEVIKPLYLYEGAAEAAEAVEAVEEGHIYCVQSGSDAVVIGRAKVVNLFGARPCSLASAQLQLFSAR